MRIEFVIEEGPRFLVRNIEFTGNDSLPESQLRESLQLQSGDGYDQRIVNADRAKVVAAFRRIGLKRAKVEQRTRSFEEPGYVDLVYEISEQRESAEIANLAGLRDIGRLAFSGVHAFDVAGIRQALSIDFEPNSSWRAASKSRSTGISKNAHDDRNRLPA